MKLYSCALTGHRDLPPDFDKNALCYALEDLIKEGIGLFYCGMARGFDLSAFECLSVLKRKYPVEIEACIPYAGQERGFSAEEKRKYLRFVGECTRKTVLSDHYYAGCLLARNRYMVDRADVVFAFCKEKTGGTAYTVNYAKTKNIPVRFFE